MDQQNHTTREAEVRLNAAGYSDTGRVREQNEDTIALNEPSDEALLSQLGNLYLLADGAGGHAAGEVASKTAVETISAVYYAHSSLQKAGKETFGSEDILQQFDASFAHLDAPIVHIRRAFSAADTRIRELASVTPAYYGMITTCIAAVVKGAHLVIAHVGDSRAYLVRPTLAHSPTITHLTRDHSMGAEMVRVGLIPAEQAHGAPSRHVLTRALGGHEGDTHPDITAGAVQAGDHVVLCCDGLWNMLTDEQIATVVSHRAPQEACRQLVQMANQAGGTDNISVIVLSFS